MKEDFRRIMVLTDFSPASIHAAEEAAMIATKFNSELHLLHVSSNSRLSWLFAPEVYFFHLAENNKEEVQNSSAILEKIKSELERRFELTIECHEAAGKLCETVNKYVDTLHIDLVVLGAKKENWFKEFLFESNAKDIIRSVNSEVLCVYPESNSNRLKKIVLPIGKYIPKRKIRLAYELAKKFAANVHLISLTKNGRTLSNEDTRILMASYQYLKDITNVPIECKTVLGSNLAQATVQYAEDIGADLILVNAGSESLFKGSVLRRWSGNIVNHSSIPVLSVHAINNKNMRSQYRA
ncbi:MAG TPA: universal stress protein [Chitinophagaceae bacterium]|jgi:nucleotide-binding universal stress UspA family protein|nr:universal stress protein [Chitinophagaceae bacterium]